MTWIWLAIAAYFLWAITNLLDKILLTKYIKDYLGLSFLALIIGSIFVLIYIAFAYGFHLLPWVILIWALFSGLTRVLSYVFYYKAVSIEEVSRVTIFWQLSPIFTLIIASIFIKESLTFYGYLAFVLLVLAGLLASLKFEMQKYRISSALGLMTMAALLIAISTVIMKYVFQSSSFWEIMPWILIAEIIATLIFALLLKKNIFQQFMETVRKGKLIILINELFSAVAFIIFSLALALGSVSLISALSVVNPIFVFLLAIIITIWLPKIFKEEIDRKTIILKISAIVLISISLIILNYI